MKSLIAPEEDSQSSNNVGLDVEESFLDNLLTYAREEGDNGLKKRPECARCSRPMTVCWCPFLPSPPVDVRSRVFILQHPLEELRKLRTAPMLFHSLSDGKCQIVKGRRFSKSRNSDLASLFESPNTVLLFPSDDALGIQDLPPLEQGYNIVILDGTWTQAKGMYIHNPILHVPQKVKIVCDTKSKYVIRTQPTDGSLSTLETAAIALSVIERRPELSEVMRTCMKAWMSSNFGQIPPPTPELPRPRYQILTKPLEALCDFQLACGAVEHKSKEYRIEQGLWEKTLPKKIIKRKLKEQQENESMDR